MFQSTPGNEAGRNAVPAADTAPLSVFQSTPGNEAGRNPGADALAAKITAALQSTPGNEAGRNPGLDRINRPKNVSIHARQ